MDEVWGAIVCIAFIFFVSFASFSGGIDLGREDVCREVGYGNELQSCEGVTYLYEAKK